MPASIPVFLPYKKPGWVDFSPRHRVVEGEYFPALQMGRSFKARYGNLVLTDSFHNQATLYQIVILQNVME